MMKFETNYCATCQKEEERLHFCLPDDEEDEFEEDAVVNVEVGGERGHVSRETEN